MIWISGISFLTCCFLMASWLPHNKIVVATGLCNQPSGKTSCQLATFRSSALG